ncbi:MAG: 50S ribosomal protein L35 [Mycoplasmoidaceae bacterium]|nr:50S ribosomal protein L35 [Mycoplasmoidaceae bacterium]
MAKIKAKTKRAVAKRLSRTASGKLKRKHAFRSHLAHNKTQKQKRQLRKDATLNATYTKNLGKTLHN